MFVRKYHSDLILDQFEGLNLALAALKISYLEQLNSKIFALLSTRFSRLKIDLLIKQNGIKKKPEAELRAWLCLTLYTNWPHKAT